MSYRILFEYWGRGLLVAAFISAIAGLLIGNMYVLYLIAGICLILSLLCLVIGRRILKEGA